MSEASGSLFHSTAAGTMRWVLVFWEPCRDNDEKLSEVCRALLLSSSAMRPGPGAVSVTPTLLNSAVVPRYNEMKGRMHPLRNWYRHLSYEEMYLFFFFWKSLNKLIGVKSFEGWQFCVANTSEEEPRLFCV